MAPKGLTDALTAALPRAFHLIKKVALEASNTFARRRRRWGCCFVIDLGTGTGMGMDMNTNNITRWHRDRATNTRGL